LVGRVSPSPGFVRQRWMLHQTCVTPNRIPHVAV
jgi:hypothetical protein